MEVGVFSRLQDTFFSVFNVQDFATSEQHSTFTPYHSSIAKPHECRCCLFAVSWRRNNEPLLPGFLIRLRYIKISCILQKSALCIALRYHHYKLPNIPCKTSDVDNFPQTFQRKPNLCYRIYSLAFSHQKHLWRFLHDSSFSLKHPAKRSSKAKIIQCLQKKSNICPLNKFVPIIPIFFVL